MGEPPESDKPQRGNVPVQVSLALQQKLLEAFEKRYKKPGKSRARTGEFLTHWAIQLGADAPSDQAVLNVLKGKRDTAELWLVDGLCRLLIGYSYAEWSSQPTQAQGTSSELSQLSQSRSQVIPPCPYRGLDAFRKEDAPFFCGRENFIEQLEVAVRKKPLVAVIGRSGSGKSSVVFAGLIPKLGQKRGWLIRDFRPEKRPFYNLAKALISLLEPKMTETDKLVEVRKQAEALQQGNLALQDVVEAILQKKPSAQHFLLVVDQFEELYTLCQVAEERQQFLNQLVATVAAAQQKRTPNFTLLITLRDDFLGQAIDYPPFGEQLQQWKPEFILSMNPQELKDAIEKPAQKLDVQLQEGLTQIILDMVTGEPGSLPLLEFALKLLWEKKSDGKLTHAAYEEIGGVEKALANHAENVYQKLTEDEQQRVQHIFTQLVCPGAGTEDTRRLATRAEVGQDNWDLVTYLANQDARLVVTGCDEATGEPTVEVVHEALIRGWERLREWMEKERDFRIWQEGLRAAMRQWEASGKDNGVLLRGKPLAEAENWLQQREEDFPGEQDYIRASLALRQQEIEEQNYQKQQLELAQMGQIDTLSRYSEELFDQHKEFDALIESLRAGISLQRLSSVRNDSRIRVLALLRQAVYGVRERNRLAGHNSGVNSISFSPDGKTIVSGSWDSTIKLWDIATGEEITTLKRHSDRVTSVSFSPNGKTIVSGSWDNTIKLWDIATGEEITTLTGHRDFVCSVSFSPDGKTIASASGDETIKLWNISTGQQPTTLKSHSDGVISVSFSPDGKTIASSSYDHTIKLWDIATGEEITTLKGHSDWVSSVSFSPVCEAFSEGAGKTIASGSCDKTIKLWDIATGKEITTLQGHSHSVISVSFSPDGKTIASGSADQTIKLWDIATGKEITTLKGHNNGVSSVSFSPDGKTIASGSRDKTIKLWDIAISKEITTLKEHNNGVSSVSFSPDGKTLVSGNWDKTIKLWDVVTGQEINTLIGHSDSVSSVSFSPDGKTLVSGGDDNTVILWNFDLDDLLVRGCNWVRPYLQHNPNVSESDRHLCDGIGTQK